MKDIQTRFWRRVDKTESCWLWTGGKNSAGYGKFSQGKKSPAIAAHRYSYQTVNPNEDINGWMICHHCDVKACVNPAHLYKGTHDDNMRDAVERNRIKPRCKRGDKVHTAKLTEDDVRDIRKLHAQGHSQLELARRYGMGKSATAIYKIVYRQSWAWLED